MKQRRAQARAVWVVFVRELAAYGHAPIAYVVAVLFLALQGFSFWALVSVLADPAQAAPPGAVLRSHFGGTFLHFALLFTMIAVIAMRLIAEDKRQGTWEGLVTAPVSEGAVVIGKWLGALAFYAALWLPTLLFPAIIAAYAPPDASLDLGPIATAYAGVLLGGAAFLAIGIAASAATSNQIIAAVVTFAGAMALLFLGQLGELMPAWLERHPSALAAIRHIDVRGHMDSLARGAVALGTLVFYLSVALAMLLLATTIAVWGRRHRNELQGRALATGLCALILTAGNILVARQDIVWDVSASRVSSLDPRTEAVLATLSDDIDVWVIRADLDIFAEVQDEVDRLLARMARIAPHLKVRALDPAAQPGRLEVLSIELALPPETLREGGVVVFERASRRRAVSLLDMADFRADDLGVGKLAQFRAEEAFVSTIRELVDADRPTLCHTTGHGELPMTANKSEAPAASSLALPSWAAIAERAERDGARIEPVTRLSTTVPAHCRVLIIAGPTETFTADEAGAVHRYLKDGGRVLLAMAEIARRGDTFVIPRSGLELVAADYGIGLPQAVAVDPDAAIQSEASWLTTSGYSDHPIVAGFRDRRTTLWSWANAVQVADDGSDGDGDGGGGARGKSGNAPASVAKALVTTSASGFGEKSLATLAFGQSSQDDGDLPGPVAVAAAAEDERTGGRLVVFGSASSLAQAQGAGELLAAAALSWLAGSTVSVDIGAKTPEHIRLLMSQAELSRVFVLCVVVMPLAAGLLGAWIAWRRRRV